MHFDIFERPNELTFESILSAGRDSATGPDCIGLSCWRAAGPSGIRTLTLVSNSLGDGAGHPLKFNSSFTAFPPKGAERTPSGEVHRHPKKTRPITMKNEDNKLIGSAWAACLEPSYRRYIHMWQRGFVAGRQLIGNVFDLDAFLGYFLFSLVPIRPWSAHYLSFLTLPTLFLAYYTHGSIWS